MRKTLVCLCTLFAANPAFADGAFGFKASTLGLGFEGVYTLGDRWAVRGGINAYGYEFDDDVDGIAYDGDLDLANVTLGVDFRPGGGKFRLTAGIVYNDNEITAAADPNATYTIGSTTYTQAEVGVLAADVTFDQVAPYVGIGYDISFGGDWRLSFDLGAAFQGDPEPSITSTGGLLSGAPQFQADLEAEEQNFRDDLDGFDVYPVVGIALSLTF